MLTYTVFSIISCAEPPKSAGLFGGDEAQQMDPASENCHNALTDWPSDSHLMEMEVIDWVNNMRSSEQDCRTEGTFLPTHPLKYEPHLQCSSRYHSLWMSENNELNHDSFGGDLGNSFFQRVENAKYEGYAVGENIAAGYDTARSVVMGWMSSDGHCSIIMSPAAEEIGIGYVFNENTLYFHWWTLNVGSIY
jgi:uncharacterized protein YkwD